MYVCIYIYIYIVDSTFGLSRATSTRRPSRDQKYESFLATFFSNSF